MKYYVKTAESIARIQHKKQTRWDGITPYIEHPKRVANLMSTDSQIATAWLHDVLEDTNITLKELQNAGIPGPVLAALKAITKKPNESYLHYIIRVSKCKLATEVKIADIKDNVNSLPKGNRIRHEKYSLALYILKQSILKIKEK